MMKNLLTKLKNVSRVKFIIVLVVLKKLIMMKKNTIQLKDNDGNNAGTISLEDDDVVLLTSEEVEGTYSIKAEHAKIELNADGSKKDTSADDNSLAYSEEFSAITGVVYDDYGHVSSVETTKFTIPAFVDQTHTLANNGNTTELKDAYAGSDIYNSDNIYYPSELPENPYEIRISENQIMNFDDRDTYLPAIYEKLNKYAELVVKMGVNVQKGQEVIVRSTVETPEFALMVSEECYKLGAKEVTVEWRYSPLSKLHYNKRSLKTLSEINKLFS